MCPVAQSSFVLTNHLSSLDGIVSYLKKQAGPASVELKTEQDFTKFVSDHDASVVGELNDKSLRYFICIE